MKKVQDVKEQRIKERTRRRRKSNSRRERGVRVLSSQFLSSQVCGHVRRSYPRPHAFFFQFFSNNPFSSFLSLQFSSSYSQIHFFPLLIPVSVPFIIPRSSSFISFVLVHEILPSMILVMLFLVPANNATLGKTRVVITLVARQDMALYIVIYKTFMTKLSPSRPTAAKQPNSRLKEKHLHPYCHLAFFSQ